MTQIDTGLTNTNSFRGEVESVQGADILARSFPGGLGGLTNVIVPDRGKADAVRAALEQRRELVAQVLPAQQGPPGTRLDVVLRRDPFATATFDQVPALRRAVKAAGGSSVLVGGPTAEAYDYRKSATRDNFVVLPLALLVVFVILAILLRSLLAPLLLVLSVILSFFAALGTGIFFFEHVFGFQGVDPSLPLLTFVFLVALGIDYNIFLMARVREETLTHGTRQGMLRGLAVTGGGHHVRRHRAGRHLQRARRAAAGVPDRDRLHHRVRRPVGHVPRAFGARPGARVRPRAPDLVAVAAAARRGARERRGLRVDGRAGCDCPPAPLQQDEMRGGPVRLACLSALLGLLLCAPAQAKPQPPRSSTATRPPPASTPRRACSPRPRSASSAAARWSATATS